jgi:hypothetical protein
VTAIATATGSVFLGLLYPIAVAVMTFFVGTFMLRETYLTRIWDEVVTIPEATPAEPGMTRG